MKPLLHAVAALLLGVPASILAAADKPNVLFIAIDDLRPELGCYGSTIVKSPNLDRLAAEGRRFDRAYCQQAICSPSRASLMTGARPDTIGVVENTAYFRALNPGIVTLPQHFIAHGYEAVYSGKVFHSGMDDEEHSWSRPVSAKGLKKPNLIGGYAMPESQAIFNANRERIIAAYGGEGATRALVHGPVFEAGTVEDDAYFDGYDTSAAIQTLDELVKGDKPWFLALGFHKPHLPFVAPKKYFDLYDPSDFKLATQTEPPKDGAAMGLHASFELRTRDGIPKSGTIDDNLSRQLLHAYYACTSYVDAQIGRILAALDKHGMCDNTIIVVWGDHGWHLGEYGIWGKATNFEIATRVPLIVWTPDMKARGKGTSAVVELVGIYPTLCDLAHLPKPSHLEGTSFAPLLDNPELPGDRVAISQFPNPALREWAANPLSAAMRETFFGPLITEVEERIIAQQGSNWDRDLFENHLMGYALRTDRYRYVEWRDRRDNTATPVFVELYNHQTDPCETVNVGQLNPEVVTSLSAQLHSRLK